MKLDEKEIQKDTVRIVNQKEVNKHEVKWTLPPLKKGHTLWEINLVTGAIVPAVYEEVNVEIKRLGNAANYKEIKKKVLWQKDCIYIGALNIPNALKKFEKQAKNLIP